MKVLKSVLALVLCLTMLGGQIACTSADTMKVVNMVLAELPAAIQLAQAILGLVNMMGVTGVDPATLAVVSSVGPDVIQALKEVQALASAYVDKPNETTFQRIIEIIDHVVQETDGALLSASHIKNEQTKAMVTAELAALSGALHLIDGWLLTRQTTAQVKARAKARRVKLEQIKSYLDIPTLDQKAREQGTTFDEVYTQLTVLGF